MGSLALLARDLGMKVTGCDLNVYPPMSDQLDGAGIKLIEGFNNGQLKIEPDLWVIGNIATRSFPLIESILNQKLALTCTNLLKVNLFHHLNKNFYLN